MVLNNSVVVNKTPHHDEIETRLSKRQLIEDSRRRRAKTCQSRIPYDSIRKRHETLMLEKEEFCPYEAESPDEIPVLQFLPFHSERKRMSVVIDTPAGPLLYCKGADSAILPRLRQPTEAESVHSSTLKERLDDYSCKGLRTLAFAMRLLKQEEWDEFMDSYRFVMSLSSNDRDELLSQKADEIEKDLELLGVTGIEDRLQASQTH
ncbi:hypothetical protein OESDEN_03780 [Oesophagostomum dentatum]|uniref:Uncharacterized protein n=1 Tax=Oesophagostomum dentatum TaxID=61180 RepID=A0A0B1TJJ2_OESDE|nr:hypothetical protein OESDEN_03780 [Oesophagostomum dentatum]